MEKLRIIVGGFLGLFPAGGVTWDYIQYPLGFAQMGHDVFYIEDTRLFPVYQKPDQPWDDSSACVAHLKSVMESFGLGKRWAYRDEASGETYGLSQRRVLELCRTADVFINLSCSTVMRDEYAAIPARILLDTDPMFTQIQYATQQSFTPGKAALKELANAHNHHFTFGENVNEADCRMPPCGLHWQPTRQPVCLNYWRPAKSFVHPPSFTTVMNWAVGKVLQYEGEEWGQKDWEFPKIDCLPKLLPQVKFSAVVNATGNADGLSARAILAQNGWVVLNADHCAGDWKAYRGFLAGSYAEFSVAKHTYVKALTGWFSCRSACYLAAGKPVITQDTGWSRHLPTGEGLLAFTDLASAKAAVQSVMNDYTKHCRLARLVAEECFDSRKVLESLLSRVSATPVSKRKNFHVQ